MTAHTSDQWASLCQQVQSNVNASKLGSEAWVLLIASALATSPAPELLAEFYTHLTTNDPTYSTPEAIATLSLRLRDILLKQVTLTGAPQVLMAFTPLAAAEGSPEIKAQTSQLSNKWTNFDPSTIHARGQDTIYSIYGPPPGLLHERIFPLWGAHTADIQFMELFTVYGLYLSDFEHLTPVETELVVFTTISCLGLGQGPALWHLRGLGRLLGARGSDEEQEVVREAKDVLRGVKVAAMVVVDWVGGAFQAKARVEGWPNVGDVCRVLGGWGDDA